VHLACAALRRDRRDLPLHRPGPYDQPPTAPAQRGVQVGQAVGEEGGSVRHVEPGGAHPRVTDEQRHHLVRRGEGGGERGMVVQTQVRGEQDDRHGHVVAPES
jgi:hypothetical protein